MKTTMQQTISELLVDGHVHVHESYDEGRFLTAAWENLSRHGSGMPTLFLAETASANVFARWRGGDCAWQVERTEEEVSLVLGGKLLVLAGRQIATAERLEVIALFTDARFKDGESWERTLAQVRDSGAMVLLPWGMGKWSGNRGRMVAQTVANNGVLLGDNAGRPTGWPTPGIFQGRVVLPGTDPLRMQSEQTVVGTYGFKLQGRFDLRTPAKSIAAALQGLTQSPRSFGARVGVRGFVRQQVGLRLAK